MPIYEFYCAKCNTLFNFFSRGINTTGRPPCPKCRKKLERLLSTFAVTGSAAEPGPNRDLPIDDARMEKAVTALAGEAERIGDDPRQAAKLMRQFSDMTGMEMGKSMNEAINRLEGGEDPEKIESEMGDLMNGGEEPFVMPDGKAGRRGKGAPKPQPSRDKTLYEM